ncbi:MAG: CPBP family intramembrane metalloprotease [Actinobacteria bacterium]|nr:CPBP family intramembrane metalloprotease [Actinomycetota bacterium]
MATVEDQVIMSNVFTIRQIAVNWQEAVIIGLLAVSVILWIIWLIKALRRRGTIRWGVGTQNRPEWLEVALAAVSMSVLAWLWMKLLKGILESENLEPALAGGLAELLSCLLILGLLGWKRPERLKSLGLTVKGLRGNLGWGLILALAVWPMATLVLVPVSLRTVEFLYRWLWDLSYTAQAHTLLREINGTSTTADLWLVIILAVGVAPLTEEILFRGLLQGWLVRLFRSRWAAIVVSAGIFAMLHLAARENVSAGEASLARIETIPALFVLALVLGYAYEKSGSLYRPMVIHLVFNGLSLLMAWGQM